MDGTDDGGDGDEERGGRRRRGRRADGRAATGPAASARGNRGAVLLQAEDVERRSMRKA